ncbi:hypothetical protein [Kutzneria chonburiensis]|uniref:ATP-binding protein n=1 Tax=Kutzneria chonburiensis TaxID=1483604 RepID=A0ABV6N5G0_9PSEU|nr:hypothetical protein [Kutzneria chonburiensis]
MAWSFVGRNYELDQVRPTHDRRGSAVVVVAREPGMGRSSLLREAAGRLPGGPATALWLSGRGGDTAFGMLRRLLPGLGAGSPLTEAVRAGARDLYELTEDGRRPIFVDDAHLADHASMLVLRELHRTGRAQLVVTHLTGRVTPDPLDCLAYEHDITTVKLASLTPGEVNLVVGGLVDGRVDTATSDALHAASGGNPLLLRELVDRGRLEPRDGKWRVAGPVTAGPPLSDAATARLADAIRVAWESLDLARVELLCDLATELDDWARRALATALLLRARPAECLRLLESAPSDRETALLRGIAVAFGLRRPDDADHVLAEAGVPAGMRAWIAAVGGRTAVASALLAAEPVLHDRGEILFDQAARGLLAMAEMRPWQAIPHIRRAVAADEAGHVDLPWLAPYLRALLIDALLLGGRIGEATAMASGFHAARRSSGWTVAVAISSLAAGPLPPLSTEPTSTVVVAG